MKESKIVTPTLLFFMVILLLIAVYYNVALKPLQTRVDAIAMENELLKNQRMEIEMAMKNTDTIKMNIENMKETLSSDQAINLIDGKMITDDISANAKPLKIQLDNITIGEPQLAADTSGGEKTLIFIPADLSFITTYENGSNFVGSFENSKIGAYKINSLDILEGDMAQLSWKVSLSLYYYGDAAVVPTTDQSDQTSTDSGAKEWTQ